MSGGRFPGNPENASNSNTFDNLRLAMSQRRSAIYRNDFIDDEEAETTKVAPVATAKPAKLDSSKLNILRNTQTSSQSPSTNTNSSASSAQLTSKPQPAAAPIISTSVAPPPPPPPSNITGNSQPRSWKDKPNTNNDAGASASTSSTSSPSSSEPATPKLSRPASAIDLSELHKSISRGTSLRKTVLATTNDAAKRQDSEPTSLANIFKNSPLATPQRGSASSTSSSGYNSDTENTSSSDDEWGDKTPTPVAASVVAKPVVAESVVAESVVTKPVVVEPVTTKPVDTKSDITATVSAPKKRALPPIPKLPEKPIANKLSMIIEESSEPSKSIEIIKPKNSDQSHLFAPATQPEETIVQVEEAPLLEKTEKPAKSTWFGRNWPWVMLVTSNVLLIGAAVAVSIFVPPVGAAIAGYAGVNILNLINLALGTAAISATPMITLSVGLAAVAIASTAAHAIVFGIGKGISKLFGSKKSIDSDHNNHQPANNNLQNGSSAGNTININKTLGPSVGNSKTVESKTALPAPSSAETSTLKANQEIKLASTPTNGFKRK